MQSPVTKGKEFLMTDYMLRLGDGLTILISEEKDELKNEADEYRMKQYSEYIRKQKAEMEESHDQ